MAELIDKWEVVSKLITLQNNYNFFKNEWDAERLYREIAKLEVEIGKRPGVTDNNVGDKLTPTAKREAKLYWKPVKPGEWNLTCSACDSHLGCREDANYCPECGAKFVYPKAVEPEPPKGE